MKDTCFCDAIQFLIIRNENTSLAILSNCYSVGERYFHDNLNAIGYEIMQTPCDLFSVISAIQKFKPQAKENYSINKWSAPRRKFRKAA